MADLAIEPPAASSEPATRAALGRAGAIRSASLGLGALALVLGLWFVWSGGAPGRSLAENGERLPATVSDVAAQRVNGGGNERGKVTFTFVLDGTEQTVTNDVGGSVMSYSVGQPVEAVVPPDDPAGARLSGELDRPGWEVPGFLLAGAGLAALVWGGVRARALRRMRRCLDSEPWLAVRAHLDQVGVEGLGGAKAMGVVSLRRDAGDDSIVVINRGLRRFHPDLEPIAWLAGWGTAELVLSPAGGGRPLEVRPVKVGPVRQATRGTER